MIKRLKSKSAESKKDNSWFFALLYFFFTLMPQTQSQILINELCSMNEDVIRDEFDETSDWIELFNNSDQLINLDGWQISDREDKLDKFTFPADAFIEARQHLLLFASGRQTGIQNIHLPFKLSSAGESLFLLNPNGQIVHKVTFPPLFADHSYGMKEDGQIDDWRIFPQSTPDQSNQLSQGNIYVPAPTIYPPSGFYARGRNINITHDKNSIVRFTLDGSPVRDTSPILIRQLKIGARTTLRTMAFDEQGNFSTESQAVYFTEKIHELPIVHISTDPDLLYNHQYGIFVKGPDAQPNWPFFGANYWKDIVIPIRFDYFVNDRHRYTAPLRMEIHGGRTARTQPMKSIRLSAKGDEGVKKIEYPFFENDTLAVFEEIILRNASGDFNHAHMRDAYLARYFHRENMDVDMLRTQPVAAYINGQYYGLMYLREKFDTDYLQHRYDWKKDEVDIIEEDTIVIAGSVDLFRRHEDFILNNDMSIVSNYELAKENYDISNLIDYFICQSVVNNADWPSNNIKVWRPRVPGGKWRHVIFDLDVAMARVGWTQVTDNYITDNLDTLTNVPFYDLITAMWQNEEFKEQLVVRYQDLLNTSFKSENWLNETQETAIEIDHEIQRHFKKWPIMSYDLWQDKHLPILYNYAEKREDNSREFIRDYFKMQSANEIDLDIYPSGSAYLQLNTLDLDRFPWNGRYFPDYKTKILAIPRPGYQFQYWLNQNTLDTIYSSGLSLTLQEDQDWLAIFKGDYPGMNLKAYPNPARVLTHIDFQLEESGPVELALYQTDGREVFKLYWDWVFAGRRTREIRLPRELKGVYILRVKGAGNSDAVKVFIGR